MPPPIGGQNINVKRFHDLLSEVESIDVQHWRIEFSRDVKSFRKFGFAKIIELCRVVFRLFKLRGEGVIDYIIYSTGGPHIMPMLRDIVLLPLAVLCSRKVWVHFQAAGVADQEKVSNKLLWSATKYVHSLCYGALSLSEFGKRDPVALGMGNIKILSNGLEDRRNKSLKSSSKDPHEIVILYVGHLCEDKGVPNLLRAFDKVAALNSEVVLRLVGECLSPYSLDDLSKEKEMCRYASRIELAGVKMGRGLDVEYANADIFVFPTVAAYESFGLVLVEAMMWELPVIAHNWRATSEIMGELKGGICYDINGRHDDALVDAITMALSNKDQWGEWRKINRKMYEENYSIDSLRENLVGILSETM